MTKKDKRFLETEVTKEAIRELNLDKKKIKTVRRGNGFKTFYYEEVDEELYFEVKRPEWVHEKRRYRLFEDERKGKLSIIYIDQVRIDDSDEEKANLEIPSNIDIERDAMEHLRDEALYEALDKLDESERMLINLLFFNELTEREAAKQMGVSQKTVNNRKRKILEKLKTDLSDYSDMV
ncbi:sigma-70 family RNA polymerase sigma factor [Helcococcus bovis]|uniref:RNA polymerase sigma factor n=1 Tax=Helcococcus bovis TaxID=3153252 RepID=UPI0038B8D1C3